MVCLKGEQEVQAWVLDRAAEAFLDQDLSDEEAREQIDDWVFSCLQQVDLSLEQAQAISDAVFGKLRSPVGPLFRLLEDDTISEIMVNGAGNVFAERQGILFRTSYQFSSTEELERVIRGIAASVRREINELHPILDARLADGSRVNAIFGNVAIGGPALTIRKFRRETLTMEALIEKGSLTRDCGAFLGNLVGAGYNLFVSGGTSSGKTTFLGALASFIPQAERVVVIEDSAELQLDQLPNLVQMECRNANSLGKGQISMDMLIRTSLRMRPDRLVVGEVRGREVADMLQALNTGHSGLSTGHGNSVRGMLRRMEAMYLMGSQIPMDAIRAQITEAIDVMVHLGRLADGSRRVLEVQELLGYREGAYLLNPLYETQQGQGGPQLVATGRTLQNRDRAAWKGRQV